MEDEGMPTFLGLDQGEGDVDIAILSLPYELTTSYGQGTAQGPMACIEASAQVELYDEQIRDDLPSGYSHSHHSRMGWRGTYSPAAIGFNERLSHSLVQGRLFPTLSWW